MATTYSASQIVRRLKQEPQNLKSFVLLKNIRIFVTLINVPSF